MHDQRQVASRTILFLSFFPTTVMIVDHYFKMSTLCAVTHCLLLVVVVRGYPGASYVIHIFVVSPGDTFCCCCSALRSQRFLTWMFSALGGVHSFTPLHSPQNSLTTPGSSSSSFLVTMRSLLKLLQLLLGALTQSPNSQQ